MISHADLEWWWETAPSLSWTFAKTYAETAPHEYVVLGRGGCPLSRQDFIRAAQVIATFGQPAKFYSMTGLYLTSRDGGLKWWTMDAALEDTDLINQATTDRVYGVQDAPSTTTGRWTDDDAVAVDYDRDRDTSGDETVRSTIRELFGSRRPRTLDIGCGTGRLLDLDAVDAADLTAVDHSQAMLNLLVRKHTRVGRVIPGDWQSASVRLTPEFDLVTCLDGPQVDVEQLRRLSRGYVLIARGDSVRLWAGAAGDSPRIGATFAE